MTPQAIAAPQAITAPPAQTEPDTSASRQAPTQQGLASSEVALDNNAAETTKSSAHTNDTNFDASVSLEEIVANPITISRGTYSVHTDECYSVPDYYESAYAKRQPWQERKTNFAASPSSRGHYRSLFNPGGTYKNFYDIFSMSQAPSFHQASTVPTYFSNDEQCSETTFSPARKGKEYETYRPFAVESRGYTRSYFYGAAR
jgi:hypothetical protein